MISEAYPAGGWDSRTSCPRFFDNFPGGAAWLFLENLENLQRRLAMAGPGWPSYTMMINNAIPLELKQTKLKLDFLMAWRLCEYVLDCLGFLEAFQVVSL